MSDNNASRHFEAWLAQRTHLDQKDLRLKHSNMKADLFMFLRATYYRWAQLWPKVCPDLAKAPHVLAVGDLHIENFGTWRDVEGRLVWGVNDFHEPWPMPCARALATPASQPSPTATAPASPGKPKPSSPPPPTGPKLAPTVPVRRKAPPKSSTRPSSTGLCVARIILFSCADAGSSADWPPIAPASSSPPCASLILNSAFYTPCDGPPPTSTLLPHPPANSSSVTSRGRKGSGFTTPLKLCSRPPAPTGISGRRKAILDVKLPFRLRLPPD